MDWDILVEELGPKLFRYFTVRQSYGQASDLVQETLLRLYELVYRGKFDPNKGKVHSFAYGIAYKIQQEAGRKNRVMGYADEIDDIPTTDPSNSFTECLALKKAIEVTLSSSEQNVIQLYLDKELKLEEIAGILEIPVNTVKSHMSRAKKKLREYLQGDK